MKRPIRTILAGISLLAATSAAPAVSHAFTVSGVEFADFLLFDIEPGSDLQISTSEDVYIFAPSGLFGMQLDLDAIGAIVLNVPIENTNPVSICSGPVACVDQPFAIAQDVVLRVPGSVGIFGLDAGGSIVLDAIPIPEPSTLSLVGAGLLALSRGRRPTRMRPLPVKR